MGNCATVGCWCVGSHCGMVLGSLAEDGGGGGAAAAAQGTSHKGSQKEVRHADDMKD